MEQIDGICIGGGGGYLHHIAKSLLHNRLASNIHDDTCGCILAVY